MLEKKEYGPERGGKHKKERIILVAKLGREPSIYVVEAKRERVISANWLQNPRVRDGGEAGDGKEMETLRGNRRDTAIAK